MGQFEYRPPEATYDMPAPRHAKHHPEGPARASRSEHVYVSEPHPRHDPRPDLIIITEADEE